MKNPYKKIKAFTLAEVTVVIVIIGIVAATTLGISKRKGAYYVNKYMSYAAFTALQDGVVEMLIEGCTPNDVASAYCAAPMGVIPQYVNAGTRGFCNRLSDIFNTIGASSCTASVTSETGQFDLAHTSFRTSNGLRFFYASAVYPVANYTMYIDIDGARRNGKLNDDVIKFNVTTTGTVLPSSDSKIATDTGYLTASVRYPIANSPNFQYVATGVNYLTAVCDATGAYTGVTCSVAVPASVTIYNNNCRSATGNLCEVVIDKPKAPLF